MSETIRVRVVDQVYNADGHAVLDSKGRPRRCAGTYLYATRAYLPGDIIDMPANIAALELKLHGGSEQLPPILERAEVHEARLRQQAEVRGREDHERTAFLRKQAELEAQVAQSQKLKDLVREREEELRLKGGEVERARAEVPQDVAARLQRLEEEARAREEDAHRRHRETEQRYAELLRTAEGHAAKAQAAEEAAKAQAAELERLRGELAAAKAPRAPAPAPGPAQPTGNPRRPG